MLLSNCQILIAICCMLCSVARNAGPPATPDSRGDPQGRRATQHEEPLCLSVSQGCLEHVYQGRLDSFPHAYLLHNNEGQCSSAMSGFMWNLMGVNTTAVYGNSDWLGHIRALQSAQTLGHHYTVVALDSVSFDFVPYWRETWSSIMQRLGQLHWDVVALSWSLLEAKGAANSSIHDSNLLHQNPTFQELQSNVAEVPCYLVTRPGITKLLRLAEHDHLAHHRPLTFTFSKLLKDKSLRVLQPSLPFLSFSSPEPSAHLNAHYYDMWLALGWTGPLPRPDCNNSILRSCEPQGWKTVCVNQSRKCAQALPRTLRHSGRVEMCAEWSLFQPNKSFGLEIGGGSALEQLHSGQPKRHSNQGALHRAPFRLVMGDDGKNTSAVLWIRNTSGSILHHKVVTKNGRVWRPKFLDTSTVYFLHTDTDTEDDFLRNTARVTVYNMETDAIRHVPAAYCTHEAVYDPKFRLFICASGAWMRGVRVFDWHGNVKLHWDFELQDFTTRNSTCTSWFQTGDPLHWNGIQLDLGTHSLVMHSVYFGVCILKVHGAYERFSVSSCEAFPVEECPVLFRWSHGIRLYGRNVYSKLVNCPATLHPPAPEPSALYPPAPVASGQKKRRPVGQWRAIPECFSYIQVGSLEMRTTDIRRIPVKGRLGRHGFSYGGDVQFLTPTVGFVVAGPNSWGAEGRAETQVSFFMDTAVVGLFSLTSSVYGAEAFLPGTPFISNSECGLPGKLCLLVFDCLLLPSHSTVTVLQYDQAGMLQAAASAAFLQGLLSLEVQLTVHSEVHRIVVWTTNCRNRATYVIPK